MVNRTKSVVLALQCVVTVLWLLWSASTVAAQPGETNGEGKFEIRLKPEKETIMLGEPLFFAFEVMNLSGENVCLGLGADSRNELGRPDSFKVSVKTRDGVAAPQPEVTWGGGFGSCAPIEPAGSYTVNLFLPHWATIEQTGSYRINVRREMRFFTYERSVSEEPKYAMKADVSAGFTIVAYDENRMGGVIHSLGSIMLNISDPRAVDSARALASIRDKRVITYFVEALRKFGDSDSVFDVAYSISTRAIIALGTYDDDRAIEALQAAMKSRSEDTRYNLVTALDNSPHRSATTLLIEMHADRDSLVRSRVAHGLAKVRTKESLAILRKLLNDEKKDVRKAARESLDTIEKQ